MSTPTQEHLRDALDDLAALLEQAAADVRQVAQSGTITGNDLRKVMEIVNKMSEDMMPRFVVTVCGGE